ncbi:hypothetical protein B0T21DRAFT_369929 [Apiosordaria backusii]|uniref:Uncharacterized protein n=1 Tax=Apiosordaria backusii TaxID=314023 RepID=A0AA40BEP3_9PEZI|nr:hypothetical protein B0T21DRAFT_369929 [Apiosordaria backusii]
MTLHTKDIERYIYSCSSFPFHVLYMVKSWLQVGDYHSPSTPPSCHPKPRLNGRLQHPPPHSYIHTYPLQERPSQRRSPLLLDFSFPLSHTLSAFSCIPT